MFFLFLTVLETNNRKVHDLDLDIYNGSRSIVNISIDRSLTISCVNWNVRPICHRLRDNHVLVRVIRDNMC